MEEPSRRRRRKKKGKDKRYPSLLWRQRRMFECWLPIKEVRQLSNYASSLFIIFSSLSLSLTLSLFRSFYPSATIIRSSASHSGRRSSRDGCTTTKKGIGLLSFPFLCLSSFFFVFEPISNDRDSLFWATCPRCFNVPKPRSSRHLLSTWQ